MPLLIIRHSLISFLFDTAYHKSTTTLSASSIELLNDPWLEGQHKEDLSTKKPEQTGLYKLKMSIMSLGRISGLRRDRTYLKLLKSCGIEINMD